MSNNQNKTFIALHGGKECKLINPYDKEVATFDKHEKVDGGYINHDWADFEQNNPTIALTEVMPEGEMFEGVEDWRYRSDGDEDWTSENSNAYKNNKSFEDYTNFYADETVQFQLAIKPLKAIEPVKETRFSKLMNCERCVGTGKRVIEKTGETYKCETCNGTGLWLPLVDVVENKETVEDAAERVYEDRGDELHPILEGVRFAINWQQSQSIEGNYINMADEELLKAMQNYHKMKIEGIVGFVLEYFHVTGDGLNELKAKIIKEYNNGK